MARRLAALLGLLLLAGCGGGSSSGGPSGPTDPDLTVRVEGETLVAVDSRLCHVRGTLRNITASDTLDVTMRWQAISASEKLLGRTAIVVGGLLPGTAQDFETTAFISSDSLIPCSSIARFERFETIIHPR